MKKFDKERVLLAVAGPVIALAVAFVLSAIVLVASGKNPVEPFALMFEQAGYSDVQVLILNQSEGQGGINLNGYRFDVNSQIAYMFGPGELVVFTFQPTQTYASSGRDTTSISYASLGISGYVGSPEMIGRVMGGTCM